MNKFTPKKWEQLTFSNHELQTDFAMVRIGGRVHMVGYSQEDFANAKLISAAPDLLEALEALADSAPSACCVDFHHKPGDYHDADESCPALDRYEAACLSARAAIARARGEA